eukprot:m.276183 g.276183  ORF g.276183 m.276183 type:complete len:67 (-) comp79904_c0_seq1:279-479(-)
MTDDDRISNKKRSACRNHHSDRDMRRDGNRNHVCDHPLNKGDTAQGKNRSDISRNNVARQVQPVGD